MTLHRNHTRFALSVLALLTRSGMGSAQTALPPYLHAPSVTDYATHNPEGLTILPTGRYIQPVGKHLPLARWPHGMVLSPDGKTAFVASAGVGQLITDWNSASPSVVAFSPAETRRRSNAGGAAFSPTARPSTGAAARAARSISSMSTITW